MKFKALVTAVLSSVAVLACSASAYAAEALVQGVGFWGAGTPATAYSAPGESFLFSFDVPNPLDANPTLDVSNFLYELNGVSVAATPTAVAFFALPENGMFDMYFPDHIVSIYGADIASTGVFAPSGFYSVSAAIDDKPATAEGGVTLTVTPVPEASTWAAMLIGVAAIGAGAAVGRKRRGAVAAA